MASVVVVHPRRRRWLGLAVTAVMLVVVAPTLVSVYSEAGAGGRPWGVGGHARRAGDRRPPRPLVADARRCHRLGAAASASARGPGGPRAPTARGARPRPGRGTRSRVGRRAGRRGPSHVRLP